MLSKVIMSFDVSGCWAAAGPVRDAKMTNAQRVEIAEGLKAIS